MRLHPRSSGLAASHGTPTSWVPSYKLTTTSTAPVTVRVDDVRIEMLLRVPVIDAWRHQSVRGPRPPGTAVTWPRRHHVLSAHFTSACRHLHAHDETIETTDNYTYCMITKLRLSGANTLCGRLSPDFWHFELKLVHRLFLLRKTFPPILGILRVFVLESRRKQTHRPTDGQDMYCGLSYHDAAQ